MSQPSQRPIAPPDATPQSDIVLATLNARYIHTAFGLRYLHANLGPLAERCQIKEFTTQSRPLIVAEAILAASPRIVGLGVYIWNTTETLAVVKLLKALDPGLIVVLGGPEISFETSTQPLFVLADHVIIGEGETAFAGLCADLLSGPNTTADLGIESPSGQPPPPGKLIQGGLPSTASLVMPYDHYSATDIADRVIYVEASRGCPYRCEFCLSALDKKVRTFPLDAFLAAMRRLFDRGARSFKFVDRTFNLSPKTSEAILRFFLDIIANLAPEDSIFLHFEMVPDRFPVGLRDLIATFPPGVVQFEVGVQTLDSDVALRIDRRQKNEQIFDNLAFLIGQTGVHVHADLIVGLPGEDLASFGRGFNRLLETGVHEIQVGILKRLRGAPIARHTADWRMLYSPLPPYELLRNASLTAAEMGQMRRFARYWDVFANSGRFARTMPLVLSGPSAFLGFLRFSDWLHSHVAQTHALSLKRCVDALFSYLTSEANIAPITAAGALAQDYRRVTKKVHVPTVLQPYVDPAETAQIRASRKRPRRQQRHVDALNTGAKRAAAHVSTVP